MRFRIAIRLLVAGGFCTASGLGAGQEPADGVGGTRLATAGRREVRLLRTAAEHLENGRADEAIVYLQSILDGEADGFFEAEEGSSRFVSLRAEAARRLESSEEATRAYELRYGPTAKTLFTEAAAANDLDRLANIARRFPGTGAGRDAALRLAVAHLDAGEPLAAAVRLDRLRAKATGDRRKAVLLRLAIAFERVGEADRRDAILRELAALGGTVPVQGGEWSLADSDALRRLMAAGEDEVPPLVPDGAGAEWSAEALTDPFRSPDGPRTPTDDRLAKWAAQTGLSEFALGRPAVPSSNPVAASDSIFFRTPTGLSAIDAKTGRLRWRTLPDPLCWDYLPDHSIATANGEAAARAFVGQRLWSDATWGTLTTDGRVVFAVEECGVAAPLPPPPGTATPDVAEQLVMPTAFNRLAAYDVRTGGRVWEAGGPPGETGPLAGAFFLGPPAPVGGHWYGLAEIAGVTHLVAIDPSRPDGIEWTQPVAEHDSAIDADPIRRTAGLSPCVAGGVLVCPVGPNLVVAVDPASRSLVWAHGGRSPDAVPDVPNVDAPFVPVSTASRPPDVISTEGVVLIGSPAGRLTAIDPLSGTVRWETRPPGNLWLIATDGDTSFLQAATGIIAYHLIDGTPAWDAPAAIGPPSGRGVRVGDRLYVPLADATLAILDAKSGRTIASIPSPHDEPYGNLIVSGGSVVGQSATRIVALPLPEGAE